MPKLFILRGLPGSGKTTYAKALVESGWARVNKDDLRDMAFNGEINPRIAMIENQMTVDAVTRLLSYGLNVVVDNMNLDPINVEVLINHVKLLNAVYIAKDGEDYFEIELKDFNHPLEECIYRDNLRPKPVTEAVIRKIAAKWMIDGKFPELSIKEKKDYE
jgi:predicted kinase